ncbi:MAG TPA: glycosyltransferase family 2 protein [Solirubrobacterales bacterium]|nr:glycosyltransferase family 2 protein [Solirubrobacterales bacterium]
MTTLAAIVFWLCALAIVYAQVGYPLALRVLLAARRTRESLGGPRAPRPLGIGTPPAAPPLVSLIVPAYDEEEVIADKVADALRLHWPRERLQVIVADDGSTDATAERAREAGADLVLELPPGGKVAALNEAVAEADGELLAFSDANAAWAPDALTRLVAPFADERVGYVCGQVRFLAPGGDNLEGAYWRYEMAVREMESELAGITAGNGAIYAVRRSAYEDLPPSGSHDLSFPFRLAKRGLRSLYEPAARAEEKMVPTIEGEFARKRRMMIGLWDIVVGEGMLIPRGYPPLFAFELFSHRLLRYATPFLHVLVFLANLVLLGSGWFYYLTLLAQVVVLGIALLSARLPDDLPVRLCRYYVLTQASIALGLWDRLRHGSGGRWEKAEGTR